MRGYSRILMYLVGVVFLLLTVGCIKEYSYEGGSVLPNPLPAPDTTQAVRDPLPPCNQCKTLPADDYMRWSFTIGSKNYCGPLTRGVVSNEGNFITFWGPSACTADSGLIIEASFPNGTFLKDVENVSSNRMNIFYYDNLNNQYVLRNRNGFPFTVVVASFSRTTRIAKGFFFGEAFLLNGQIQSVQGGQFHVLFK